MAEMAGHSTPVKALTQMTMAQNATDKRTPAKPAGGPQRSDGGSRTPDDASGSGCSKSPPPTGGIMGAFAVPWVSGTAGVGACSSDELSAEQWQDFPSAQHAQDCECGAHEAGTTAPGSTWASWKTSPRMRVMTTFAFIPRMRITLMTAGSRQFPSHSADHFFSSSFFKYLAGSLSNFALHFLQQSLISCPS